MTSRIRLGALRRVDDWRFWMVLAYFGLAFVVVALFFLFSRISHEQQATAREQAARDASTKASNASEVQSCFSAVRNLPIADGFVATQREVIANSIASNRQSLAATSETDPLRAVRVRALKRLADADKKVDALDHLIRSSTPRQAKCNTMAHDLHVKIPPPQTRQARR